MILFSKWSKCCMGPYGIKGEMYLNSQRTFYNVLFDELVIFNKIKIHCIRLAVHYTYFLDTL